MMPTIMFALVNAAAVALGWWALRRRRPAPGTSPEQPYPGYEGAQYEGPLQYADHARREGADGGGGHLAIPQQAHPNHR
jgi:hypothetical protein